MKSFICLLTATLFIMAGCILPAHSNADISAPVKTVTIKSFRMEETEPNSDISVEPIPGREQTATTDTVPEPNPEHAYSYSEYRFPIYEGDAIPGYTAINYFPDKFGSLFVFCSTDGTKEWRVYAERDVIENDAVVETQTGFIPCLVRNAVIRLEGEPCCKVEIPEDVEFVDISAEPFGTATKKKSNDKYVVKDLFWGTYDDVNNTPKNKIQWSYMWPKNDDSSPAPGAIPVTKDSKGKVFFTIPGGDQVLLFQGKIVDNK